MSGDRINLSCKSLLLFLQSLNVNSYIQLIGFGSDFKFFSDKPLEYNKENVKNVMDIIRKLSADRGGTELYEPLNKIYTDKIYDEYEMKKNIILLTDGELFDKEKVINLIGANSNKFIFNSIGIGYCDKDLIERTALMGNGYSYYISNLNELNSVVISLLEKSQNSLVINCTTNQKCSIEDDNKKLINKNDYFTHGFILDDINIKNIDFNIKINDNEIKVSYDKNKMTKLPNGDNLGKLIVDKYLKSQKCKDSKIEINLSKEYNILTDKTAFYATITNETKIKEKMIKMKNKNKEASNNKIEEKNENNIKESDNYIYNDTIFGYDNEENTNNINNDNIIKKKKFSYKIEKRENLSSEDECCCRTCCACRACRRSAPSFFCNREAESNEYYDAEKSYGSNLSKVESKDEEEPSFENREIFIEKKFNFDEFILSQDVIEGNWTKDNECEMLIEQEKNIYEKIRKYSENKKIKDENGIITLFVLYYIYNKKSDKVAELKFVINKAKKYVKKVFKLEYDEIIKEISV